MTNKQQKLKIFLCHASENKPIVQGLYERLSAAGFAPWLDSHFLLPGMDWDLEIQKAMRSSDAVIVCLSKISVVKEGYVQKEIKYAQEIQKEKPEGTIFLIPLQLEECEIPFSLQDVQWGEYFESDGFEKLVKALNLRAAQLKRILGVVAAPTYKGLPPGSYIPFPRNAIFTGREEDLKKLSALCEPNASNIVISQAITGMGGVGKTQLAVEFAYRYGHYFKGVHWLDLRDPDSLDASVALCGTHMGLAYEKQPEQVAHTLRIWQTDGPRLLILDNFEDVTKAGNVLGRFQHPSLRILITSRRKDFPKSIDLQTQELNTFSEVESLEFLGRTLEREETEEDKKALAEKLGFLPLALELAASYININGLEISTYLNELEDVLAHESMRDKWFDDLDITTPTEHDQSLLATFQLSWQEVKDETARKIFVLAGYCIPNTPIPLAVFREVLDIDNRTVTKDIYRLSMLNLLIGSNGLPVIHPLLASFARSISKDTYYDVIEKISLYMRTHISLKGSIEEPIVFDAGGATPSAVIRTDQNWQVQINWSLEVLDLPSLIFFTGVWFVRLFLKPMTHKDYELQIGESGFRLGGAGKLEHTISIRIAPKTVDPGIYQMAVVITYEPSTGIHVPIVGFYEGKKLQLL